MAAMKRKFDGVEGAPRGVTRARGQDLLAQREDELMRAGESTHAVSTWSVGGAMGGMASMHSMML